MSRIRVKVSVIKFLETWGEKWSQLRNYLIPSVSPKFALVPFSIIRTTNLLSDIKVWLLVLRTRFWLNCCYYEGLWEAEENIRWNQNNFLRVFSLKRLLMMRIVGFRNKRNNGKMRFYSCNLCWSRNKTQWYKKRDSALFSQRD